MKVRYCKTEAYSQYSKNKNPFINQYFNIFCISICNALFIYNPGNLGNMPVLESRE